MADDSAARASVLLLLILAPLSFTLFVYEGGREAQHPFAAARGDLLLPPGIHAYLCRRHCVLGNQHDRSPAYMTCTPCASIQSAFHFITSSVFDIHAHGQVPVQFTPP